MPNFHSLRSFQLPVIENESREPFQEKVCTTASRGLGLYPPIVHTLSGGNRLSQTKSLSPIQTSQASTLSTNTRQCITPRQAMIQVQQPVRLTRELQPLQPQLLITALQLPMETKTGRLPTIIPAEMRRAKKTVVERELSPATCKTISRFKLGIVIGAMIAFICLTAFSFAPVNQNHSALPLVDNAMHWVQSQQSWNSVAVHPAQTTTTPVVTSPSMPNIPQNDLVAIAQQDALKYGISPVYFVRQIYAESSFNPNAYSPAGAIGIAQFMPSTAASLGVNPYDPISSLDGAARLMASLNNQFGGNYAKALAAYNAGPGAVINAVNVGGANWLACLPYETQNYVHKIMG
jgi:hypothetical protein